MHIFPMESQAGSDYYSFDGLDFLLDANPLPMPTFQFTSVVTTEQPVPFFSPPSDNDTDMDDGEQAIEATENQQNQQNPIRDGDRAGSFSQLGSRLPSLQPEDKNEDNVEEQDAGSKDDLSRTQTNFDPNYHTIDDIHLPDLPSKHISDITSEDRHFLQKAIGPFFSAIPPGFVLPTRLSLGRYIRAYADGFHEHLPFLHIPSMRIGKDGCSVELVLAMAAVGAQYCFEAEQGLGLFHAARAISIERIRRRDARVARSEPLPSGPLGLATTSPEAMPSSEDLMQSGQALLLLMAMATWARHKEILREALAIQSILASIVRDDGLSDENGKTDIHGSIRGPATNSAWHAWARRESVLRTKYIVYCFFNLHCIVYDIPPLILNSEIYMRLPCNTASFKASTAAQWKMAAQREAQTRQSPVQFQDAVRGLFSGDAARNQHQAHSALGNYVLIHAIVQHIFFVRQSARCRFDTDSELTAEEAAPLDQAVRNWQAAWKHSPESSVNPLDPNGPVAFNSTALLRLAYIRLNMDTGPGRALGTRDPVQIAHALRNTPPLTLHRTSAHTSSKLIRALLHAAHALSIPVKIGIRLVAKTQTFTWSIQHSLCSLECALILGKWLEAMAALGSTPNPPVTAEEERILSLVHTVLDETEYRLPRHSSTNSESSEGLGDAEDCGAYEIMNLPNRAKRLNAGVLRVWAAIFRGSQTWDIVEVIGNALAMYADLVDK
ncbi:hypothetical protein Sste5346_002189 [Sporothrix stenoceras]|uniref:Xylanolytic transcriptional activator regulatory domain-containing protein n=1 Tax=Sporothrix stenoceras TaxID=5173 RepID=A0ABR3ZLP3_9PEZI